MVACHVYVGCIRCGYVAIAGCDLEAFGLPDWHTCGMFYHCHRSHALAMMKAKLLYKMMKLFCLCFVSLSLVFLLYLRYSTT